MADEKEIKKTEVEEQEQELELDELDEVTGGSLRNVSKKKTSSISSSVRNRV